MKKLILITSLIISFSVKAQSFIGKTETEIKSFTERNGYKVDSHESDTTFHVSSTMYSDPKLPVHHLFEFGKSKMCIAYTIWVPEKSAIESVKKEIETKSEKLSSTSWVQKIAGKSYSWNFQGGEASGSFTMQEIKP